MNSIYIFLITAGITILNLYSVYKIDKGSIVLYKALNALTCLYLLAMNATALGSIGWAIFNYNQFLAIEFVNTEPCPKLIVLLTWIANNVIGILVLLITVTGLSTRNKLSRDAIIWLIPFIVVTNIFNLFVEYSTIFNTYDSRSASKYYIAGTLLFILPYGLIFNFYSRVEVINKLFNRNGIKI